MEKHEMILALVVVALAGSAVYLALTERPVAPDIPGTETPDTAEAEALLMKGLSFGKEAVDYTYSYDEVTDGYRNSYTIRRNGAEGSVHLVNPLSSKEVLFLENDTILCMKYGYEDQVCTSVQNDTDMKNYIRSMEVKFFNDTVIAGNINDIIFLLDKGYLELDPDLEETAVGGRACTRLDYRIDFSSITVSEAARFGIGASSPKIFDWTMCIDQAGGDMVEKSFSYEYQGSVHASTFTLEGFQRSSDSIEAPAELAQGAVQALTREKQQQAKLVACYTELEGDKQDRCINEIALYLKRKDLCALAGGRSDQCLVALVPITKDESICSLVMDGSFKEDCFIELAGAFKDASYCDEVSDAEKNAFCLEVAVPSSGNETASTDTTDVDIQKLLEAVDAS